MIAGNNAGERQRYAQSRSPSLYISSGSPTLLLPYFCYTAISTTILNHQLQIRNPKSVTKNQSQQVSLQPILRLQLLDPTSSTMGCTSSIESAPGKSNRVILYGSDTNLPNQRYLADPLPKHTTSESSSNNGTSGSGQAARPTETFEAYARRGIIRQSALLPERVKSKRT